MEKIKLSIPVIVEGKYDKIALSSVVDGQIITTDGFGIFNNAEKRALIKRLSERGVIVLCDSDSAGGVIRAHLSGIVKKELVYSLYVPQIKGKEKRKQKSSAEGYLGVEGVGADVLRETLESFIRLHPQAVLGEGILGEAITKADFYALGLSGGEGSSAKRDALAAEVGLPVGMTANALLSALNYLISKEDFLEKCGKLFE